MRSNLLLGHDVCAGIETLTVGVQRFRSLRLYSLSASFTSLAPGLLCGACSTCCRFLSSLGRVLSSVTSSTKRRTCAPKCSSTSSRVVSVSSTVSWSRAACNTTISVIPASWVRIRATPSWDIDCTKGALLPSTPGEAYTHNA